MTRLHLVRHGRAAAGWDADVDPPLDSVGEEQASRAAAALAGIGPVDVVSSPLRRCRETAAPLAATWSLPVRIETGVAEIPSPDGVPMAERIVWLRAAMKGTWADLGPRYVSFRDGVVGAMRSIAGASPRGAVVFSHFIAINAVIGAARGDDRLVIHSLDNASITEIEIDPADGSLRVVRVGREADTLIR